MEYSRLNLKIPTEMKDYLTIASAQESINRTETVSITEYLCTLIAADMKKNAGLYNFCKRRKEKL